MSKDSIRIAVILEAAGNAERYGSNKLLAPLADGSPMISNIMNAARSLEVYRRVLVTQYDKIAKMAEEDFEVVINYHPELGISLSMQLGIEAAGDADAYMFCVCDQPGLKASTLKRLIHAYKAASEGSDTVIASLSWQGRMYNPKVFSSVYKEELMALSGDSGGRQIINNHLDDLLLVQAESEDEVIDIDTPISVKDSSSLCSSE